MIDICQMAYVASGSCREMPKSTRPLHDPSRHYFVIALQEPPATYTVYRYTSAVQQTSTAKIRQHATTAPSCMILMVVQCTSVRVKRCN